MKKTTRALAVVGAGASIAALAALVPVSANAADASGLTFSAQSGVATDIPTWQSSVACPGGSTGANLFVVDTTGSLKIISLAVGQPDISEPPFTAPLQGSMGNIHKLLKLATGSPTVFEVVCTDGVTETPLAGAKQDVTFDADGNWALGDTAPGGGTTTPPTGPAATTTSLTADPTTATQGDDVTLTATVHGGGDGSVEFDSNGAKVDTAAVTAGVATLDTKALPVGTDSITAIYTPTDATSFSGSTSSAVTVTINPTSTGGGNGEPITVTFPQTQPTGDLTITVPSGPVNLSTPTAQGTVLEATGNLNPVTVTDSRSNKPGWDANGADVDFTSGSDTLDGNDLGWQPSVSSPNAAADVTPGAVVAPNTPGLKAGATLGSADAGKGIGSTGLGAGLTLDAPVDTPPGTYTSTVTLTVLSK